MKTQSYTSLKMWSDCPYLYYRTYVRKDLPRPSGPALERGSKVHSILEQAVKERKPPHSVWVPDGMLDWIWRQGGKAELELALDAKLNRVDFWDKTAVLRGKLDVTLMDDGVHVIDWKTGQYRVDRLQAEVTSLLLMRGRQASMGFTWVFVDQEKTHFDIIEPDVQKKVAALIRTINEDDHFPPRNGWRCRFCQVPEGDCQSWERGQK